MSDEFVKILPIDELKAFSKSLPDVMLVVSPLNPEDSAWAIEVRSEIFATLLARGEEEFSTLEAAQEALGLELEEVAKPTEAVDSATEQPIQFVGGSCSDDRCE